jgi:hypothetical protein
MLGLAMGTMPARRVGRDQKSVRRQNQNNEAYIACEQWEH